MFGHLNVLAETQRRKAVIIVTDSILCFLNGKRSRTAYEPVQELNKLRLFGVQISLA